MVDACDDCVIVVEVSREWVVLILLILFRALEVEEAFATTADFVRPIAAFDPVVIE